MIIKGISYQAQRCTLILHRAHGSQGSQSIALGLLARNFGSFSSQTNCPFRPNPSKAGNGGLTVLCPFTFIEPTLVFYLEMEHSLNVIHQALHVQQVKIPALHYYRSSLPPSVVVTEQRQCTKVDATKLYFFHRLKLLPHPAQYSGSMPFPRTSCFSQFWSLVAIIYTA